MWQRLLQFLIREVETCETDLALTALSEIEQALIVMFLKSNRHTFSHLLQRPHRDAAPRQVRLAEEYIEAHWNQPLTVETMARLTTETPWRVSPQRHPGAPHHRDTAGRLTTETPWRV